MEVKVSVVGWGCVMPIEVSAAIAKLDCERLRTRRRGRPEKSLSNQSMVPAIKMLVGDWYVDEFGIPTREITAHGG